MDLIRKEVTNGRGDVFEVGTEVEVRSHYGIGDFAGCYCMYGYKGKIIDIITDGTKIANDQIPLVVQFNNGTPHAWFSVGELRKL